MLRKLCVAAGLTLALGAPVSADELRGSVDLGLPGSAGGTGLGIGADLKGRAGVTPPEASSTLSGSGQAAGTITHSDVSASTDTEMRGSVGVGASGFGTSGSVSGGAEAKIRGEAGGSID